MKKLLLSLGAASLAIAPVAASAATRAGDVVPSAASVSRSVTGVSKVERLAGGAEVFAPLALILLTIIVAVIDENDDDDSDG